MFELAHSWMLLALPLPWIVNRVLPAYRKRDEAIKAPFFQKLVELSGALPRRGAIVSKRPLYRLLLMIVMWSCIVIALARPQYVGVPIKHEKSARDLMVAVDLSGSMQARDFVDETGQQVDRLTAVKSVLKKFVEQRPHDRLGLIVFGDSPFLQAPFTQDHETWLTLLDETQIAMAGMSTAFGDAIGLAIKHFRDNESQNRVLIVLTDGNDTGSRVPPIEAAKVAQRFAVTIYPVAIGDPETSGEEALDISALQRVAEITGGIFYQALDRQQLKEIYQRIGELEPQLFEAQSYRPRTDLHHIPMGLVTLLMSLFMLLTIFQVKLLSRSVVDD
jgi:Ca-activated chloride channel family protein